MDQISPVAWIVIILFLLFIIGLNVSLFNALRNPSRSKIKMERTPTQTVEAVRRLGAVMRDPLANERSQLNALSEMVHQLEDQHPKEEGSDETLQDKDKNP